MRIVVTGGSGFIGGALATHLAESGHDVVVADLKERKDLPCVVGDLRDPSITAKAVGAGTDAVVHLAARTSVLESKSDPWGYYTSNLEMTARLLEAAREAGAARFVFASTNAVAGPVEQLPITEKTPLNPLTPYGATKAAAEMLCSAYGASFGVGAASVRLTNVYGPNMVAKDSFVPRLMRAAASGSGVEVFGDGSMIRDYVYLDDVVAAFSLLVGRSETGPVVIGSGTSITVNELIDHARQATGIQIPATYGPSRPGEMPAVVVDIGHAQTLGYRPQTNMAEGMKQAWSTFAP